MASQVFADNPARFTAPSQFLREEARQGTALQQARQAYLAAQPGPHLVVDGLFDPDLLNATHADFDNHPDWRKVERSERELCFRSDSQITFGPAVETYFALVNSGPFVRYLQEVTGMEGLIADATLERGGLHETRKGGFFEVHRDFTYHRQTDLKMMLVVLTYLNHDWQDNFGGHLELWDEQGCQAAIAPTFGRTVILGSPHTQFHGHPHPLNTPDHITRRSLVTYYYANQHREQIDRGSSQFLLDQRPPGLRERVRRIVPAPLRKLARALR